MAEQQIRVKVVCGANSQWMQGVAGLTVAQAKDQLREALNIPGDAQSIVTGENVQDTYVLQAGDVLEFVKKGGRKG